MPSRAERLYELGQSIWLDFIRRGHLVSGEFDRLVRESGVVGVTSNPTIFQQAITQSHDYDDTLSRLVGEGLEPAAIFDRLAAEDIQDACDRLRPVFERTDGLDGRVSIEVGPALAKDTPGTIAEVRRLRGLVSRDNVMVKIPATAEGVSAIHESIADGSCINVTLIFSLARYEQVMEAYVSGLERRAARGEDLSNIVSVASFFVSRVDTKVDKAIDEFVKTLSQTDPRRDELLASRGKAAIANARLAYARFLEVFGSKRFAALSAKGARVQRPLWASTSTKNPAYPDTMYVDELVGPDTVNTLPPQTLEAYNDHGSLEVRIGKDLPAARALFERLPELGIPLERLIDELEGEGVAAFAKSYDELIAGIESRRREFAGARGGR
jgi:transaldolase